MIVPSWASSTGCSPSDVDAFCAIENEYTVRSDVVQHAIFKRDSRPNRLWRAVSRSVRLVGYSESEAGGASKSCRLHVRSRRARMFTEHPSMDSNLMPKDLVISAQGVRNEIKELQEWLLR